MLPPVPDDRHDGPPAGRGWWRGGIPLLIAFAAYAAIAVVAYLPTLPLDSSRTQICTCADTAQGVWFLAWVPFALEHGHSLFFSSWVLYPRGVNLLDNTSMPLLGFIFAPVTRLAGPVAAYNLVLRAAFTLSALAMFATVRRLVRWWPAAFLAGLLYGFSPFMVGQGLSHEFLVFAPIPPLVLGIMIDVLGARRMPWWLAGPLLGVLFAAQFLIAAETFAMMALFTLIGTLLALCYQRARRRPGHLALTTAGTVAVGSALLAYPVDFFSTGRQHIVGSPHPLQELSAWHADLLGAFRPTSLIRYAPPGLVQSGAHLVGGNLQENGTYLGLPLVLLVAGLAIWYWRRPVTAIAGLLAVLSYALSLGPRVYLADRATQYTGPFSLLASHVAVIKDIETVRFSLFTAMFCAVVLGTGLGWLRFPAAGAAAPGAPAELAGDDDTEPTAAVPAQVLPGAAAQVLADVPAMPVAGAPGHDGTWEFVGGEWALVPGGSWEYVDGTWQRAPVRTGVAAADAQVDGGWEALAHGGGEPEAHGGGEPGPGEGWEPEADERWEPEGDEGWEGEADGGGKPAAALAHGNGAGSALSPGRGAGAGNGGGDERQRNLAVWIAARCRRPVLATVLGVAALLPLVPRWPYAVGAPVTPRFFTTAAVNRIRPGTVVATYPFPARTFNQALVWQADASFRFRLLGGSAFFVPGPQQQGVESLMPALQPKGLESAFVEAYYVRSPSPATRPGLEPWLLPEILADVRRYHIGAILIDPRAGRDPTLAVRYVTAALGRGPVAVDGVLGWFDLGPPPAPRAGSRSTTGASG